LEEVKNYLKGEMKMYVIPQKQEITTEMIGKEAILKTNGKRGYIVKSLLKAEGDYFHRAFSGEKTPVHFTDEIKLLSGRIQEKSVFGGSKPTGKKKYIFA
jgi:hypothetical protein